MVGADSVKRIVRVNELDLSGKEGGIAHQRLIEQINSLPQVLRANRTKAGVENEVSCPTVEFEGADVRGRALLNRILLRGRELRL